MDDPPAYQPEDDGPEARMARELARTEAMVDRLLAETRWPNQIPEVRLSMRLWLRMYGPGSRPRRW